MPLPDKDSKRSIFDRTPIINQTHLQNLKKTLYILLGTGFISPFDLDIALDELKDKDLEMPDEILEKISFHYAKKILNI